MENETEDDEISTSYGDGALNDPVILSEVRATLAVGAALNINLLPNDKKVFKKMVAMENKGEIRVRENTGGRGNH